MPSEIPLFPLNTVLFPSGPLPLRVFEPRYLDMVSDCLKHETGIGIVLIKDGSEVGGVASTYDFGTVGHIGYWHRRSDGLLGVTVVGDQRFRILNREVQPSGLLVAEVELIDNEPTAELPEEFEPLSDLLDQILRQFVPPDTTMPTNFEDASWVGGRLCELLPMQLVQKQNLLKLNDPVERLERLYDMLHELDVA